MTLRVAEQSHLLLSILLPAATYQKEVGNGIQDDKDNFGIF